ncbi:MAG: hypothetical protein ACWA44_01495 [Thiotrichales bacterium]
MKGIIIAVPNKYENTCLINVQKIRNLNPSIPIEIWEVGQEITDEIRDKFKKIRHLTFKNVDQYPVDPNHWKGFQVKAFILAHTDFEDVMLCDADAIIHQDPEIVFMDKNYLDTGSYFFRDLDKWKFYGINNHFLQAINKAFRIGGKFNSRDFFLKRKQWLTQLLPRKPELFPKEWDYIYSENLPSTPVKEALQESGVVFMNKSIHEESVNYIYQLNDNHKETYQHIWGDKETFWIGCLMAGNPFYFTKDPGYISKDTGRLTHDYNGAPFFSQKG